MLHFKAIPAKSGKHLTARAVIELQTAHAGCLLEDQLSPLVSEPGESKPFLKSSKWLQNPHECYCRCTWVHLVHLIKPVISGNKSKTFRTEWIRKNIAFPAVWQVNNLRNLLKSCFILIGFSIHSFAGCAFIFFIYHCFVPLLFEDICYPLKRNWIGINLLLTISIYPLEDRRGKLWKMC